MASLAPITGTLGLKRAAHLLRRATFGFTKSEMDDFAGKTISQAVDDLMQFPAIPTAPADGATGTTWNANGSIVASKGKITSWWLHQILDPDRNSTAFFKLTFLLHTCLTISLKEMIDNTSWYYHLRLLMTYAGGSYKTLVTKMTLDPAMGKFLDTGINVVGHANENYGRELLELFTVGKGPQVGPGNYTNYTEDDIREAAKVLTGFKTNTEWDNTTHYDPDTNFPRLKIKTSLHDSTDKQFSSIFGNRTITGTSTESGMLDELDQLVDMIFDQESLDMFIMKKVYRYYVSYIITPEIENDIIVPMAQTFRANNFEFRPVLTQLFNSAHFYDEDDSTVGDEIIGGMIKSPLELYLQTLKYFQAFVPDPNVDLLGLQEWLYNQVETHLTVMGMEIFSPPSVAGYEPMYQEPDYNRYWINASSLPQRYHYVYSRILNEENMSPVPYGNFNMLDFVEDPANIPPFNGGDSQGTPGPHEGPRIAEHLVRTLLEYLLPVMPDASRVEYFLNEALLDYMSFMTWEGEWDDYRASGNDSMVRPQLNRLFKAIIQSPEYQLG